MAKTEKYKIRLNEPPQQGSSFVMTMPQPPARKAEEYLKAFDGYVYTASGAIAQDVACMDLKLFKVRWTKTEAIPEEVLIHPALSVLEHVNDFMSFYELIEATQIYLELVGEAFWVVLRNGRTGEPQEIWPIRPDWVKVIPDGQKVVGGYIYNPGGDPQEKLTIPVENMIHFKYFNPLNPYRGKGSVQAAAMPLDIHQFAQDWNRNFFFNSALPGMVFTSDKNFNRKAIKEFVNQWQSTYGGRQNAHKIAFLGGGFKLEKATMGARDLDFSEQQKIMRDDILAVFRVPKTILGLTEDVNRANAEATTRAFMERVITPRMKKIVGTLTERYLPMFKGLEDYFFDFTDPSPEDVETKLKIYENARKYQWMTPNEIRVEEGLEPIEGGDTLGTPTSQTEEPEDDENMTDEENPNEPTDDEEDTDEEEKGLLRSFTKIFAKGKKKQVVKRKVYKYRKRFKHMMPIPTKRLETIKREELQESLTKDLTKLIGELMKQNQAEPKVKPKSHEELWTEDAKNAYWLAFIEKATRREVLLRSRVVPVFEEMETEVLAAIDNAKTIRKEARKETISQLLPDLKKWKDVFLAVMTPILYDFILQDGNDKLDTLDVNQNFKVDTDGVRNYFANTLVEFVTGITDTTREQLRDTLVDGLNNKESVGQLSKRVKSVMKEAKTTRATLIARTEAIRASNFASFEAYKQSGVVVAREWLSERDTRTCPFCLEMDGKILGLEKSFFDKGDHLTVDGQTIEFTKEAINYPPLHPRCRCTDIPVLVDTSKRFKEQEEKETAEDIIALSEIRASQTIDEAVKKANEIVEKAKEHAELLRKEGGELGEAKAKQIEDEAIKTSNTIVLDAKKEADTMITQAENEAKAQTNIFARLFSKILGGDSDAK